MIIIPRLHLLLQNFQNGCMCAELLPVKRTTTTTTFEKQHHSPSERHIQIKCLAFYSGDLYSFSRFSVLFINAFNSCFWTLFSFVVFVSVSLSVSLSLSLRSSFTQRNNFYSLSRIISTIVLCSCADILSVALFRTFFVILCYHDVKIENIKICGGNNHEVSSLFPSSFPFIFLYFLIRAFLLSHRIRALNVFSSHSHTHTLSIQYTQFTVKQPIQNNIRFFTSLLHEWVQHFTNDNITNVLWNM